MHISYVTCYIICMIYLWLTFHCLHKGMGSQSMSGVYCSWYHEGNVSVFNIDTLWSCTQWYTVIVMKRFVINISYLIVVRNPSCLHNMPVPYTWCIIYLSFLYLYVSGLNHNFQRQYRDSAYYFQSNLKPCVSIFNRVAADFKSVFLFF